MNHTPPLPALPPAFQAWFAAKGWAAHPHQLEMLAAARAGRSALLIAPTGGGKTLAGFLASLVELAEDPKAGLHTLYISPLKALAVDIHRNLTAPIEEIGLAVTAETRTGDTPASKRQRQRRKPPHILLTTPESLALLLSYPDAGEIFAGLRCVVVDELHALAGTKRGELLALALARLGTLAPEARRVGLSATVAHPAALEAYLSKTGQAPAEDVTVVRGGEAAQAEVKILLPGGEKDEDRLPWAGHMGLYAIDRIYAAIQAHRTTLVFVNTRAQAELIFQALWHANEDHLPIALHHGSLAAEQRRKVEAVMAKGGLRAVVATSSLDLGIDWAAVDLVLQVGAPKGTSRLLQRIGRANHRLDTPSRALLVPANRFEVLECKAALDAMRAGELDGDPPRPGGLDVLAQHVLGTACAAPFDPSELYAEVITASPYAELDRETFDAVVEFVRTGGYALKVYDRFQRIRPNADGRLEVADKRVAQSYRMNVGTIVEAVTVKVRMGRGRILGEIEEYFVQWLRPGDTFLFAGRLLTFQGMRENFVDCTPGGEGEPAVPAYMGGKLPLTTQLAHRVRGMLEDSASWPTLPGPVEEWLELQRWRSVLPKADSLLVETFPRADREYLVAYTFAGRNAHQTLGMLLTRRMERMGLGPLGFVATDYVIAVWSVKACADVDTLFDQDMLGDDLEEWMAESSLLKRTFRNVAVIAGLIERKLPGHEKTGRQVTFNADLIYDVLRKHQPDHILLQATREDAARGLTDIRRLSDLLVSVQGRIVHRRLDRVSPLAVPILLEVGKEQVAGGAIEALMDDFAESLIEEAIGGDMQASLQL
ncbi:ligase-associated DNA damage response DEXH box helicase [Thalassobaculum sp. OXR-137]|uniref:ligase-associated DNA damage response DEXH box helicase n=1 Tax=Thalassobaculum sp. OXR-137 TaxID=3100173 RepID=UPI002AC92B52|nr:ligase-associated DNA damage response DEXH box helicase [Thalassobaculum sp. OXR-137]WPZ36968.1 ligase-associated DNA damage response DEXH box helicase [Thalassobaculum sp. OXR-137]